MPPTFAAAPKCTTCSKSVYFAEQQIGPAGKIYHKGCMRCLACNKSLDSFSLVDREGDPYCKACYGKHYGPKGYGAGGALVGEYVDRRSPLSTPSTTPRPSPATTGTFPSSILESPTVPSPSPLSRNTFPQSSMTRGEDDFPIHEENGRPETPSSTTTGSSEYGSSTAGTSWRTENSGLGFAAPRSGNAVGGAPRYGQPQVGGNRELCRRCGTVVYAAEAVLAAGQKWHRRCLRCAECSTTLSSHLTEKEGLPYCKKCYTTKFGTGAQGIMSRPGLF
ncbi:LIM-domain-containing protein [Meredithblackwellia eburnea MCA 4105]